MGINLELDTTNYDETQLVTLYFVTDDSEEGLLVPVTRLISTSTRSITYASICLNSRIQLMKIILVYLIKYNFIK